jgi:hypothetical protein
MAVLGNHKNDQNMGSGGACPRGMLPPLGESGGHPRNSTDCLVEGISIESKNAIAIMIANEIFIRNYQTLIFVFQSGFD